MNGWIRVHQNDAGLVLAFVCRDESGAAVDLSQMQVHFSLYRDGVPVNSDRSLCRKSQAELGLAEYTLQKEDTAVCGLLHGVLRMEAGEQQLRQAGRVPVEVGALP